MASSITSPKHVKFGVFELDVQNAELRKSGVKVKLQDQPLKVLRFLLENRGEIVSREQVRTHIWTANTFVEFDQGLYSAMARLRDALGDSSGSPRFIETVARRGYRFIAPVTEADQKDSAVASLAAAGRTQKWRIVLALVLVTAAIGGLLWRLRHRPVLTEKDTIVVG